MAYTVGLTGGIASGKSLVAGFFVELGIPVLDADQVARDVVEPGTPALAEIVAEFGPGVLLPDGRLDRAALRREAFGNVEARKRLEAITHPRIRQAMAAWQQAQTSAYCLLAIPLLVEGRSRFAVDRVLVVDVPVEMQIARLMQRDGIDEALALRMIAAQAGREQRLALADDVIVNDGSPEQARAAVHELHQKYLHLATCSRG